MTEDLETMLEKLMKVDPETWQSTQISLSALDGYWENDDYSVNVIDTIRVLGNWALDLLQGCIQRACERRGWEMEQNYRVIGRDAKIPKSLRHYAVITVWGGDVHTYRGSGSSAEEALLSAYLEALQHEA